MPPPPAIRTRLLTPALAACALLSGATGGEAKTIKAVFTSEVVGFEEVSFNAFPGATPFALGTAVSFEFVWSSSNRVVRGQNREFERYFVLSEASISAAGETLTANNQNGLFDPDDQGRGGDFAYVVNNAVSGENTVDFLQVGAGTFDPALVGTTRTEFFALASVIQFTDTGEPTFVGSDYAPTNNAGDFNFATLEVAFVQGVPGTSQLAASTRYTYDLQPIAADFTVIPVPAGLPLAVAPLGALAWLRQRRGG